MYYKYIYLFTKTKKQHYGKAPNKKNMDCFNERVRKHVQCTWTKKEICHLEGILGTNYIWWHAAPNTGISEESLTRILEKPIESNQKTHEH